MAIAFTYDESDNKVVVTGGTEGTPAIFADFVTADRAGTAELTPKDAPDACTTNMTLTYQIRPVEDLALQITFTLASTSAGAGDTLDVTGTDWHGDAQNESIDVAAGDGAYTGAKYWQTITDIDCTGWADGTLKVTQPQWGVIWDYGNGQYQIDALLHFGDESTATYFASENELVIFNGYVFYVKSNAHARLGALTDGQPINGSYWKVINTATYWNLDNSSTGAYLDLYNSIFDVNGNNGHVHILTQSEINRATIISRSGKNVTFNNTGTTIKDLCVIYGQLTFSSVPTSINGMIHDHATGYSAFGHEGTGDITITGAEATNDEHPTHRWRVTCSDTKGLILRNPITAPTQATITIDANGRFLREEYSCNIEVADKDGTLIDDVVVDCEDKDGTAVWTAGTIVTGATTTGLIDEQWIPRHKWEDTAETETDYSPHKFTLSKAGYETLVLDNITVDGVIDWHLELQGATGPGMQKHWQ